MRKPLKPVYCPICGSQKIKTESDNSGNGSYHEWYWIKCNECEIGGEIAVKKNYEM